MTDAEFVAWARRYLTNVVRLSAARVEKILRGTRQEIEAEIRRLAEERRE